MSPAEGSAIRRRRTETTCLETGGSQDALNELSTMENRLLLLVESNSPTEEREANALKIVNINSNNDRDQIEPRRINRRRNRRRRRRWPAISQQLLAWILVASSIQLFILPLARSETNVGKCRRVGCSMKNEALINAHHISPAAVIVAEASEQPNAPQKGSNFSAAADTSASKLRSPNLFEHLPAEVKEIKSSKQVSSIRINRAGSEPGRDKQRPSDSHADSN